MLIKWLILAVTIYLPIVVTNSPYVNEWNTKIFVDVGAAAESAEVASAWDYMDPSPTVMNLNPEFEFEAAPGYRLAYVNVYTIEDGRYRWWTGVGEEEECLPSGMCVAQWDTGFSLRSDLDLDIIIAKVAPVPGYCEQCIPGTPPEEQNKDVE